MTVGQRIAQKRKELGLSQEALGEQLGVSRQAIYKWESDASLPEIEKLVALSRIFSVPVGWLLGVEEESTPDGSAPGSGELTETQLNMVQEIVERYLAARPEPAAPVLPKRRRWPYVVGVLVLIAVFVNLFSRLDQLSSNYSNLQNSVSHVSTNVNNQISSITSRVEEILKSQNNLTASYNSELLSADLIQNTVTFTARATPKTYTEGMTAVFTVNNGTDTAEFPGELGPGREFSAEVTCGLTDDITLSVVFMTGDQRETQVLDRYDYLYTGSFPQVWINGGSLQRGTLNAGEDINVQVFEDYYEWGAEVADIQVGLFRNQKLVMWYERLEEKPSSYVGSGWEGYLFFRRPNNDVTLERGAMYCEAAVVTDQYGRRRMWWDTPVVYDASGKSWRYTDDYTYSSDPAEWDF